MKAEKKRQSGGKTAAVSPKVFFDPGAWNPPIPDVYLLSILFLLAFIVKLICLGQYMASPDFALPVGDSEIYLEQARRILAGGRFLGDTVPFQTPLYPLFMALFLKLFKDNFLFLRLVQIAVGSANVLVVYFLTLRLSRGQRVTALLAGVGAILYGVLTFFDLDLLGIFLTMFAVDVSIWLILKSRETRPGLWASLSGLCFGLAALERANLLLFVPVALWALASGLSGKFSEFRKWAWKPVLGFLAGLMVMILPVTIHNYLVSRDLVLITNNAGVNLFLGNNPKADGTLEMRGLSELTQHDMEKNSKIIAERESGRKLKPSGVSRYWARRAWRFLASEPALAFRLYLRKIQLLFNPTELPNHLSYDYMRHEMIPFLKWLFLGFGLVAPWAAVGLVVQFKRGLDLTGKFYVLFMAVYVASLLPFFITDRYRLPLVPFLIAFAAVGFMETLRLAVNRSWKELAIFAAVLLSAAWAFNRPLPFRITFGHTRVTLGDRYVDRSDQNPQPGSPDLVQAILEYKQALEAAPNYPIGYMRLARAYEIAGYFSGNLSLLDRLDQLDPSQKEMVAGIRANIRARLAAEGDMAHKEDIPKTAYEKALENEEAGEGEQAMEKYWDIIARDPYHVPAYDHLGTLYLKRGEKSRAEDIFKQGLAKNPGSLPLLDDLAETYYQLGDTASYNRLRRRIAELRGNRE